MTAQGHLTLLTRLGELWVDGVAEAADDPYIQEVMGVDNARDAVRMLAPKNLTKLKVIALKAGVLELHAMRPELSERQLAAMTGVPATTVHRLIAPKPAETERAASAGLDADAQEVIAPKPAETERAEPLVIGRVDSGSLPSARQPDRPPLPDKTKQLDAALDALELYLEGKVQTKRSTFESRLMNVAKLAVAAMEERGVTEFEPTGKLTVVNGGTM